MPAREPVSAGVRGIAIAGDVTNSVIVTGDHATVQVRVDGEDALLARLLPAPGRTPRPAPPRDFPARAAEHIDRAAEAARLQGDFVSLELHGDADIGKTWVVRHALDGAAAPDGIVYLFAKAKAYGDLLQELFDAFYECDQVYVARTSQIRRDLREKQALVVLDSHALARDELRDLLTAMPRSRFVLVSRQRVLGEGEQLAVAGLAGADALELVEQELARALLPDERADAQRVCEQLGGHPFKLRQAAARVRDGESSFAELATSSLAARMLTGLSEQETAIVAQLAALGGETIGAEHIAALLHEPDLSATLEDLRRRRVIASGSPRYRIAGALLEALERDTWPYPLAPRIDRALAHFAGWARAHRVNPSLVLTEAPALLELLGAAEANEQRGRVIELGRAIDGPFAWGRRWDTWGAVLVAVLRAARESADAGAEAWALHQSGTRAYCLGDVAGAVAALEEALRLREQLGDPAAAATRHNLDFIRGTPGGEDDDGGGDPGPAPRPRTLALLAALVVVIAISVTAVVRGSDKPTPDPGPAHGDRDRMRRRQGQRSRRDRGRERSRLRQRHRGAEGATAPAVPRRQGQRSRQVRGRQGPGLRGRHGSARQPTAAGVPRRPRQRRRQVRRRQGPGLRRRHGSARQPTAAGVPRRPRQRPRRKHRQRRSRLPRRWHRGPVPDDRNCPDTLPSADGSRQRRRRLPGRRGPQLRGRDRSAGRPQAGMRRRHRQRRRRLPGRPGPGLRRRHRGTVQHAAHVHARPGAIRALTGTRAGLSTALDAGAAADAESTPPTASLKVWPARPRNVTSPFCPWTRAPSRGAPGRGRRERVLR